MRRLGMVCVGLLLATAVLSPAGTAEADQTGSISGTVWDSANPTGLGGVCVTATSSDGQGGYGSATTGSDGSYTITGLPPDSYTVEFDPTCGGSLTSPDLPMWSSGSLTEAGSTPVTVGSGASVAGIDASLQLGGSITGTVTDAADPSGLSGVCVYATSSDGGNDYGQATTASDGTYAIIGLQADTYQVEFDPTCSGSSAPNDIIQWYSDASSESGASPVSVTVAQNVGNVDATLIQTGSISGTVWDSANPTGLGGVCVTATSSDGQGGYGSATTGSDGSYTITGLPPDSYTVAI